MDLQWTTTANVGSVRPSVLPPASVGCVLRSFCDHCHIVVIRWSSCNCHELLRLIRFQRLSVVCRQTFQSMRKTSTIEPGCRERAAFYVAQTSSGSRFVRYTDASFSYRLRHSGGWLVMSCAGVPGRTVKCRRLLGIICPTNFTAFVIDFCPLFRLCLVSRRCCCLGVGRRWLVNRVLVGRSVA